MLIDHRPPKYSVMIANLRAERASLIAQADALTHAIRSLMKAAGMKEEEYEPLAPLALPTKPHQPLQRESQGTPLEGSRRRTMPTPRLPENPDYAPPEEADFDWVSIKASAASPMAIGMAVLRAHPGHSITSANLNNQIAKIRKIEGGAGYTILEKLRENKVIEGFNGAWIVKDASKGGVFKGDRLWSPPQHLSEYDWAAIRREGIVELLKVNPALTIAGITKGLTAWEWYRAKVTDDLVKADLRALTKKGLVRRDDATKEWSLNAEKEVPSEEKTS